MDGLMSFMADRLKSCIFSEVACQARAFLRLRPMTHVAIEYHGI